MRFVPLAFLFLFAMPPAHAQSTDSAKPTTRHATPADIPVEAFFRREQYAQMAISPDGKKLAALRPSNGRDNLVVIDFLAGKTQTITSYKESDVIDFEWVTSDRLYFRIADQSVVSGSRFLKGAYAIDIDGQYLRDLTYPLERAADKAARQNSFSERGVNVSFRVLSRTFDGSGDVVAEIFGRSQKYADVYRFNTKSGAYKLLSVESPGNVVQWLLDRDQVPRIAVRLEERKDPNSPREETIWHRAAEGRPWEIIGRNSGNEKDGSFRPIAFDYDSTTLYVSSNVGIDRRAIFKYDVAGRKLGEKLLQHPMIDLTGSLIFSREKKALMGIRYNAAVPDATWFDADQVRLQASIDKALPSTTNIVYVADEAVAMC